MSTVRISTVVQRLGQARLRSRTQDNTHRQCIHTAQTVGASTLIDVRENTGPCARVDPRLS